MTRRRKIQLASVLAAAFVALAGSAYAGYVLAGRYRGSLEQTYRRALSDLNDYVAAIETTLEKAVYANTLPQQNGVAAKLIREASGAQAALAVLPAGDSDLSNVSRFLSQVGEYALSLSSKVSAGGTVTEEEYETLRELGGYAAALRGKLADTESRILNTGERIGEALSTGNLEKAAPSAFQGSLEETAEEFADYPTLIYDGPFSDHIGQMEPKFLDGKAEILQGNAQTAAAAFWGVPHGSVTHTGDTAGGLPTYNFSYGDARVSITKAGGYAASMIDPRAVGETSLGYEEALARAKDFLEQRGVSGMRESYYVIHDGKCVINFAYSEGDLIFYPDLIKVAVALDNGQIVEYDATGYLMNHHNRPAQQPALSVQEAQQNVSPHLTVQDARPCVIPTAGSNEALCYEYHCLGEAGEEVLVYLDAQTGLERQILILTRSDNGVLTR